MTPQSGLSDPVAGDCDSNPGIEGRQQEGRPDLVDRAEAVAALRESEERYRAMADTAPVLLWENDESGMIFCNAQYLAFFGVGFEEVGRMNWAKFVHPDDLEDYALAYQTAVGERRPFTHEVRLRRADGQYRRFLSSGRPVGESNFVGCCLDLTDVFDTQQALRASERRAGLLLAELQHRVRNTLAVIRSIARRTADRSETVEDLYSHFEGRLNAFARVQSAVIRSPGGGVELLAIVEDELLAVATREGDHLRIDGPTLWLKPKPAESISLAIHELATNAVKYGALSERHGRVEVRWKRLADDGGEELSFLWTETGLQRRPIPTHEGFGHEMLRRTLPYDLGAETSIEFTADGMRFSLRMPLGPELLAE